MLSADLRLDSSTMVRRSRVQGRIGIWECSIIRGKRVYLLEATVGLASFEGMKGRVLLLLKEAGLSPLPSEFFSYHHQSINPAKKSILISSPAPRDPVTLLQHFLLVLYGNPPTTLAFRDNTTLVIPPPPLIHF